MVDYNVLIVDCNGEFQWVLDRIFNEISPTFELDYVHSGDDAALIEVLRAKPYDVCILDVKYHKPFVIEAQRLGIDPYWILLTDVLSEDDLWFECKVEGAFELKDFDEPDFKKTIRNLTIDFFKRLSEKKF